MRLLDPTGLLLRRRVIDVLGPGRGRIPCKRVFVADDEIARHSRQRIQTISTKRRTLKLCGDSGGGGRVDAHLAAEELRYGPKRQSSVKQRLQLRPARHGTTVAARMSLHLAQLLLQHRLRVCGVDVE